MRVLVVGAGKRFLSGISYYTVRLSNAMASEHEVAAVLMRQLLPTRLYPGWRRVGENLTKLEFDPRVRVFDGVDWFWLPSLIRALLFFLKQRPGVVVFQWWSGTVLHSYLVLALFSRMLGARIVVEFHEILDPGEAGLPFVQIYVNRIAPLLMHLADGFVIHSEHDRPILESRYQLGHLPIVLVPIGPFDHYQVGEGQEVHRVAPDSCCNLLFFGLIRPYKGLEDLVEAFDAIPKSEIEGYWLTVVGETWEGCTRPSELIANSRYRDRITFINRYVNDDEVAAFFASADAAVFPYHRSSGSASLHTALAHGIPVVATNVGGIAEAVSGYEGAILIPPGDPVSLCGALVGVRSMKGRRFANPHSWRQTIDHYNHLFARLRIAQRTRMPSPSLGAAVTEPVGPSARVVNEARR